jgi:antitoxin PrlF
MNRAGKRPAYSKVLAGGRITLPRRVLRIDAGDILCFSLAEGGVLIRKVGFPEANDPFLSFTEWSSQADDRAYAEL